MASVGRPERRGRTRLADLPVRPRHLHRLEPNRGASTRRDALAVLHTCPIPEAARLGRTLRAWRKQILAYFATGGVSNGGTEAVNLLIEKTRRLSASATSTTTDYASCSPPTHPGSTETDLPMPDSEEPD
jgi:hypothetical protein